MVEVILYSRSECAQCEIVEQELNGLKERIPHKLAIINIDEVPELSAKFGSNIPVVEIGPYKLEAPINLKDLEISLMAAQESEQANASIDKAIKNGVIKLNVRWTASDRFSSWLSKKYLGLFNLFVLIYLSIPILAPIFMEVGISQPASWIYRAYGLVCHQLSFRSWFLFGEQSAYPRDAAGVDGLLSYQDATGMDDGDLWKARTYVGDDLIGFKIALCQRDLAIYGGILLFGLIFGLTRKKIRSIHWFVWIIFGILPIGIDGLSQLISQPPMSFLPYRESTPILRSITGFLFGFMTAWFGYPLVEESMNDTREYLEAKFKRINQQNKVVT